MGSFQNWPIIDKKLLEKSTVQIVIQINGKKRGTLNVKKDTNQDSLLKKINSEEDLKKFLLNKSINKVFFVKNRLINLLVS